MSKPAFIVHRARPDHVLGTAKDTAAQGYVVLHPYDASKKEGRLFVFDNEGYVHLASDPKFVLDVSGDSAKEGTHVVIYPKKAGHSKNQLWEVKDSALYSKLGHGDFSLGVNPQGQVIITKEHGQRLLLREPETFENRKFHWDRHEGELSVVAVGAGNNDIWGVNHLEHIYHWDGSRWTQIEGAATNISVGVDGTVWCVNKAHEIYRLDRSNNKWHIVPGELVHVSVGTANHVWGVNHLDAIYRWDNAHGKWNHVEGALKNVSVGHDGTVYGVNKAGEVYRYDGSKWHIVPGELTQIHVATADLIVGVNKSGHIYRLKHGKDWERVEGEATWVAVGHHGEVWAVNSAHAIYKALF